MEETKAMLRFMILKPEHTQTGKEKVHPPEVVKQFT